MPTEDQQLSAGVARGDKSAVARALNLVEDRREQVHGRIQSLLGSLRRRPAVHRVGLTGPPGVGKSTLTAQLARELRARSCTVGVLAVDPSSLRSGGSLLGDRARMGFDPDDQGLFVRSLATAGDAGGLTYAAHAVVQVLSAAYDRVLVETTGVGQSETDIEHVVDTVCLVVQPGSGDVLQFLKAGIMEIPDVVVVNKGDHRQLASRAASDLTGALEAARGAGLSEETESWRVPVCITSARDRTGIAELVDAFAAHLASFSDAELAAHRKQGALHWTLGLLARRYGEYGVSVLGGRAALRQHVAQALERSEDPFALSAELGRRFLEHVRQVDSEPR